MEIVYCERCGGRFDPEEAGARLDRKLCARCATVSGTRAAVGNARMGSGGQRVATGGNRRPAAAQPQPARWRSTGNTDVTPTGKPADRSSLIWIAASGFIILIIAGVMLLAYRKAPAVPERVDVQASTGAAVSTVEAPQPKPEDPGDMGAVRARIAAQRLEEAKSNFQKHPDDPFSYHERLVELAGTYRSTPSGEEAAKLLDEVRLPPPGAETPPRDEDFKDSVDVLAMFDLSKDVVDGNWQFANGKLSVDRGDRSRVELPYVPPLEYDVRFSFTRSEGNTDVNLMLSHANRPFMWMIGNENNTVAGLEYVDGKSNKGNRTTYRADKILDNGKRHTAVIQVRRMTIRAYIDGKRLFDLLTPGRGFSMREDWGLREPLRLGLGSFNNKLVFDEVRVREVGGAGRKVRP